VPAGRPKETMKRSLSIVVITAAMVAGVGASSARASTVIDFGTGFGGAGGTVNIGADITGSGIFIDTVTIIGAPVNNGVFDVEGAGVCGDAVGGCGLLSFDKNLNVITIVGSIPALGILAPVNLLSGDLSGGVNVLINNGVTGALTMSGNDAKAAQLLVAIGLNPLQQFHFFEFETAVNGTGQGSPYTAIATDVTNTSCGGPNDSPCPNVPEPATLLLLSTGVLGLARARRKIS